MGLFSLFASRSHERLRDRVEQLEDRVRALESGQKGLEVEWEGFYDNVRRVMAKISKRAERAAKEEEAAAGSAENGSAMMGPVLTGALPGQDDRSARIRAARRGER